MDNSSSRRRFLQTLGLATGALAAGSFANAQEVAPLAPRKITIPDPNNIGPMTTWPPRKPGAIYMGGFRAPKLDKVRVAFVGVGERGSMHVGQMAVIEGAEIVGICDLYEDWAKRSASRMMDPRLSRAAWRSTSASTCSNNAFDVVTKTTTLSGPCSPCASRSAARNSASAVSSASTITSLGPGSKSMATAPTN